MEQYESTIGNYRFELDSKTNRIAVYKEGAGVDPIELINVSNDINEKQFHYEIMHWACNNNAV